MVYGKQDTQKNGNFFFTEFSFVMDLFIYFSVLLLVLYWWKIPYKLWVCREATKVFFSPFPMDRLVLLEEPIYIWKYGCWKQKKKYIKGNNSVPYWMFITFKYPRAVCMILFSFCYVWKEVIIVVLVYQSSSEANVESILHTLLELSHMYSTFVIKVLTL